MFSWLEAKIRRLVEANVVGIAMWNLEGAITGANDAFLRMVQYDREDLASVPIIERHHGRIWGARNDGPGATFSFSIPRAPERLPGWTHVTRDS